MAQLFLWLDQHAGAIQAVSAVAIVILTGLLFWATRRYVHLTHEALCTSRAQFAEMQRVEVFLRLKIIPRTLTECEGKIEIANLSSRGIWWDKLSVTATVGDQVGTPVERTVEKIVPAYSVESVSAEDTFYEACRATAQIHSKYVGRVKVTATYWANGKWARGEYESPQMVISANSVFTEDAL